MVGGTAPVLTRRRAGALAALLTALAAYGATAEHLPDVPSGLDVALQSAVILPVFAAAIWLALPVAEAGNRLLLAGAAGTGALAVALLVLDADSLANVAKLCCYTLVGFWFLSLFEALWWVTLVAVLVPWVDIWSVFAGPTEYVVEERPGIFEKVSVGFPSPGETGGVSIGPPDIVFFALFLGAASRFGLRVAATWIAITAALGSTLVLVWYWDDIAGLPALPAICLGFLAPNADLLWRDLKAARAGAIEPE